MGVMRTVASGLLAGLSLFGVAAAAPAAQATSRERPVRPVVAASPSMGLDAGGQRITVTGRGFDRRVGIYVGLCVIPPMGQKPTPCGGGVNTGGSDSASAWVSSNPPPYGKSLAVPFRRDGSFRIVLTVSSVIGDVDCRSTPCAVVTRADHTRAGDRRFDVIVPVQFSS